MRKSDKSSCLQNSHTNMQLPVNLCVYMHAAANKIYSYIDTPVAAWFADALVGLPWCAFIHLPAKLMYVY